MLPLCYLIHIKHYIYNTPNKSRRKTKTEREMFKCSNVHWYHFSTYRRVHYYIGDTPPNGATNTGNININYDEGVFENMLYSLVPINTPSQLTI